MRVRLLEQGAKPPARATTGAAGFDLFAIEDLIVPPTKVGGGFAEIGRALVRTGISVEVPVGCVGRIGARSGFSVESNLEVGAGWIDPDYRGELKVELKNLSRTPFHVTHGMRIAQLFILSVATNEIEIVERLGDTDRGTSGFGSTGVG